jgi:putative serine protease PepD
MNLRKHILGLTLFLGAVAPTLAVAQDGPVQNKVEGRNSWLKRQLTQVTAKARVHVVQLKGHGYGVVIKGGYVLTSNQILPRSRGARPLQVTDAKGKDHAVVVHARDLKNGVALLRFVKPAAAPAPIRFGSTASLVIGQFVVVAGTEVAPLSAGVVSAKDRPVTRAPRGGGGNMFTQLFSNGSNKGHKRGYPSVIQYDGPLEAEHFGAPLLDTSGRLIGVSVAYPFRGSAHAVGIDQIKGILAGLEQGKSTPAPKTGPKTGPRTGSARPWLGASVKAATPEQLGKGNAFGLYVSQVKGPALTAGLKAGDVIVKLNGKAFPDIDSFAARLNVLAPGEAITLTLLRGRAGIESDVELKLGTRP